MRSTGLTIRCTSIEAWVSGRIASQTSGPMVRVRHVVVVHHVEVDPVGTRGNDVLHFFTEFCEVGREDAGSDDVHGRL